MAKVEFNFDYRKTKSCFRKLEEAEETRFQGKIEYFKQMELHQFVQGKARPRRWKGDPPDSPPDKLSRDIIDEGLFRIDFSDKMRVFAYKQDNVYYIVSVDPDHQSG